MDTNEERICKRAFLEMIESAKNDDDITRFDYHEPPLISMVFYFGVNKDNSSGRGSCQRINRKWSLQNDSSNKLNIQKSLGHDYC